MIPPIESISFNIGKPRRKKKDELEFTVKKQGEEVWLYCKVCESSYSYDMFENDKEHFLKIHSFYHRKVIEKGLS
jgi:tryptophan 2,3-dioxygenase